MSVLSEGRAGPHIYARAQAFIEQHLIEPISIDDIARAAGCSGRTVHLAFRAHAGVPPITYLRYLRLAQARTALLTTPVSVSEAAMQSGFTHLGRFSRAYYARFGELPSETRVRAPLLQAQ